MIAADRDALTCDLAETYGIFDFGALPVSVLATLAVGLREDSRIKMKTIGTKISRRDMLLAAAVDRLSKLVWFISEDGKNGVNPPKSVLSALLGEEEHSGEVEVFDSAEDFETEWARRTGASHGN